MTISSRFSTHFHAMNETASTMVGYEDQPCPASFAFDQTHLNNLFAREDTPGHRVGTFGVRVGSQIALLVDSIVSDARVSFDTSDQRVEQFWRDEELEIRLKSALVDERLLDRTFW